MFSNPPSQPGDIIFLLPGKRKSVNTILQRLIRRQQSPYSHVAIAVKQGNAIHAMPKNGVHVSRIRMLLKEYMGHFVAYRNISLSYPLLSKLEDCVWFFKDQRYNKRFFLPARRNASFCSELVVKAYESIGVNTSIKRPSATLPSDIFDQISKSGTWVNVTDLYRDFFLNEDFDDGHNVASDFVHLIEQLNQSMSADQQRLVDHINADNFEQGLPPTSIAPSRRYWNVNPKRRKNKPSKRR